MLQAELYGRLVASLLKFSFLWLKLGVRLNSTQQFILFETSWVVYKFNNLILDIMQRVKAKSIALCIKPP